MTLALGMIALTSRMTRSAMLEVLSSDFIEAARAKGLPERTIVVKHALRNALIPVLTVTSLQVGFLLVGTVLVESTLGLGGLGSLITDAIQNRDYPVIQASVLFLTVAFILHQPGHGPAVRGASTRGSATHDGRVAAAPARRPSRLTRIGASALVRNRAARRAALVILIPLLLATVVPWLLTKADPDRPGPHAVAAGPQRGASAGHRQAGPRRAGPRHLRRRADAAGGASWWSSSAASSASRWGSSRATTAAARKSVIMRILDALLAFPALLLAILVVATFGRGLDDRGPGAGRHLRAGHGAPGAQRDARPAQPGLRGRRRARWATPTGASSSGTSCPTSWRAIVVQSSIDLAYAILDIAALSFLGLGQQPPDPDWGSMLSDGRSYLLQNPLPAIVRGPRHHDRGHRLQPRR